jgi:hypothetical protein
MRRPEGPGTREPVDPLRMDDLAQQCRQVVDAWGSYGQWRRDRASFRMGFGEREFVCIDAWMHERVSQSLLHLLQHLGLSEHEILLWFGDDEADEADQEDASG